MQHSTGHQQVTLPSGGAEQGPASWITVAGLSAPSGREGRAQAAGACCTWVAPGRSTSHTWRPWDCWGRGGRGRLGGLEGCPSAGCHPPSAASTSRLICPDSKSPVTRQCPCAAGGFKHRVQTQERALAIQSQHVRDTARQCLHAEGAMSQHGGAQRLLSGPCAPRMPNTAASGRCHFCR